jgi:hypothetical protein
MTAEDMVKFLADKGPWMLVQGQMIRHASMDYKSVIVTAKERMECCPLNVAIRNRGRTDFVNGDYLKIGHFFGMSDVEISRFIRATDFWKPFDEGLRKLMLEKLKPEIA